jgi:hypothetical protein
MLILENDALPDIVATFVTRVYESALEFTKAIAT